MSDSRTKRNRKQVDYSKFALDEGDDDDDFADSTAPPSKKAKKSQPLNPNKTKKEIKKAEPKSKTERKHAVERKFEEEIQLALRISMGTPETAENTATDDKISCTPDSQTGPGGESLVVMAEIESDISGVKQIEPTPLDAISGLSSLSAIGPVDLDHGGDIIEVIAEDEIVDYQHDHAGTKRRKRSAATKAAKHWGSDESDEDEPFVSRKKKTRKIDDDDSNFHASDAVSSGASSESDDDWGASDDDSDFCTGKSKKKAGKVKEKKVAKSSKKSTANIAKTPRANKGAIADFVDADAAENPKTLVTPKTSTPLPKSTRITKPSAAKETVAKENVHVPRSAGLSGALSTASPPEGHRKPLGCGMPRNAAISVVPAPFLFGAVCVTSPSAGLRLGLSKKARIRPLHPSVNITH